MDYADVFKSDNMKQFAAKASAECLIAFLRQNLPANAVDIADRVTITVVLNCDWRSFAAAELARVLVDLQRLSGDVKLEIRKQVPGSVRLTVVTTPQGARKLLDLYSRGELSQLAGLEVALVELASDTQSVVPSKPRAATLRWLHISDLHIGSGDGYGHDIVLNALPAAFRDHGVLAELRPDLIFCTGDIAHSGKREQYEGATRFLEQLALATGVPNERIFVVPGNHDIDRALVSKRHNLKLADREDVDAFFGPDETEEREIAFRRFRAYSEFQTARFGFPLSGARPYLVARCRVGAEVIGVLGFNTAWLAHDDDHHGKLVMRERLVRQARAELDATDDPATIRVALLHHPLDWLRDFEREAITDLLLEGVDFILHGHLHAQRPSVVTRSVGDAGLLGAGAAYQGRQWPNSALLVELAPHEARVQAIAFRDHGRGIWMLDQILAPRDNGVLRFPRRVPAVAPAATPLRGPQSIDTSAWLRRLENENQVPDGEYVARAP